MKRLFIFFLSFLTLSASTLRAQEDVLQIVPVKIAADGSTKVLQLEMENTVPYLAFSFDIYFPEGISLANRAKPYGSLSKDRYPYTEVYDELEDVTTTTFEHDVIFQRNSGFTSFAVSPNTISEIKGNSGTVLRIYIDLAAGLAPGVYPIKLKNIVFAKKTSSGAVSVRVPEVSTFVMVGEPDMTGTLDLSALTGYLPKDVAGGIATLLADKPGVTGIDLSGVTGAGDGVTVGNPNTLVYVAPDTDFSRLQVNSNSNTVVGGVCENLVLTDGQSFGTDRDFTANTVTYSRTVPAAGWYSLCLPFAADVTEGVTVERLTEVDAAAGVVTFEEGAVEALKPCIFRTTGTEVAFSATNVSFTATPETLADGVFIGTLKGIPAGGLTGCFALRSDGTGFGRANATAYVTPFRGYIDASVSSANVLRIEHGAETTGIGNVCAEDLSIDVSQPGCCTVTAGSKAAEVNIYAASGCRIATAALSAGVSKTFNLPSGIYIVNNKKVIVK